MQSDFGMIDDPMDVDGSSYIPLFGPETPKRYQPYGSVVTSTLKRKVALVEHDDVSVYSEDLPDPLNIPPPHRLGSARFPPWYAIKFPSSSPRTALVVDQRRRNRRLRPRPPRTLRERTQRQIVSTLTSIYTTTALIWRFARGCVALATSVPDLDLEEQQIIAVETDSTGRKRRAVTYNGAATPKRLPGRTLPGTFPSEEESHMPPKHAMAADEARDGSGDWRGSFPFNLRGKTTKERHSAAQTVTPPDSGQNSSSESGRDAQSKGASTVHLGLARTEAVRPMARELSKHNVAAKGPSVAEAAPKPLEEVTNKQAMNKGPTVEQMFEQIRLTEIYKGIRHKDGTRNENYRPYIPPKKTHKTVLPRECYSNARKDSRDAAIDGLINRGRQTLLQAPQQSKDFRLRTRAQLKKEAEERAQQDEREKSRRKKAQMKTQEAVPEGKARQERIKKAIAVLDETTEESKSKKTHGDDAKDVAKESLPTEEKKDVQHLDDTFSELDLSYITKQMLIRPLPDEWAAKVNKALTTNPGSAVAAGPEGNDLTRADFGTLLPQPGTPDNPIGWLNDEIVNSWFGWICARKAEQTGWKKPNGGNTNGIPPPFVAYNTAWLSTVKEKGVEGISRWSRRKHIAGKALLQCEKIFFPVNSGAHWTLLIISPKDRTIEFLDSMSKRSGGPYMRLARQWLAMELKKDYAEEEWKELDTASWPQDNTNDCGVFVCLNGLAVAKKEALAEVRADLMPLARPLMAAVLLNGGFKDDWEL